MNNSYRFPVKPFNLDFFVHNLNDNELPIILIAKKDKTIVGSVAIYLLDMLIEVIKGIIGYIRLTIRNRIVLKGKSK